MGEGGGGAMKVQSQIVEAEGSAWAHMMIPRKRDCKCVEGLAYFSEAAATGGNRASSLPAGGVRCGVGR